MVNRIFNQAFNQGIGAYVNCLNNLRIQDLQIAMKIIEDEARNVILNKDNASKILDYAKDNIEDVIVKNRGGDRGVHGFIAEFAEAGIVNARRAIEGLNPIVKVLNDNGPADLLIGRNTIQMKFYNNLRDELEQSFFYNTKMKMMFPKDHVQVFEKISKGLTSYKYWMKSSALDYKDAQKNSINSLLDSEQKHIYKTVKLKQQELNKKRLVAQKHALPNLKEANKVARNAAFLQGGLALMSSVYGKYKEGKNIFEFEQSDWLDCGLDTAEGVIKGAISGYSIYGLTNVLGISAPNASALVMATYGMIDIVLKYRTTEITQDEFMNLLTLNVMDASFATIGACIGQTMIPIPVLGSVVGSIASSLIWEIGKGILNDSEQKIIQDYKENLNDYIKILDKNYLSIYNEIIEKYKKLGKLQDYSFDLSLNTKLSFEYSIELAEKLEIEDTRILHNLSEIDSYFLD